MARPRPKPPSIGANAPFPGFVEPALASSIEKVPAGARWIHEVKFDGYRVQIHLADAAVKIFTRRGNDLNGFDLRKAPLFERKALLRKLIDKTDILFSESFETDGTAMLKHACKMGLEGVVSKVRDSRYNSGRGKDWIKVTCRQRETLPITGCALKENRFDGPLRRPPRRRWTCLCRQGRPRL